MKIILKDTGEEIEISKKSFEALSRKSWPKKFDSFYFVKWRGGISEDLFNSSDNSEDSQALLRGEIFKTEKEAGYSELRRKSMAKRTQFRFGKTYWYWDFEDDSALKTDWEDSHTDYLNYYIGNTFDSSEEAVEWGEKYADAWDSLYDSEDSIPF